MTFKAKSKIASVFEYDDADTADVWWVHFGELPEQTDRLKLIACPATGTEHLADYDVPILSLQGWDGLRDVRATAEHTLMLMLMALKWGVTRSGPPGRELYGKKVYVWGMGRVGRQVADLVQAFGAVLTDDRTEADIITLHLPLNDETRGIVTVDEWEKWKDGNILINTARPELIEDCAALADCTDFPTADDVPIEFPDDGTVLVVTPHVGGYTRESLAKCEEYLADRLVELASNGEIL